MRFLLVVSCALCAVLFVPGCANPGGGGGTGGAGSGATPKPDPGKAKAEADQAVAAAKKAHADFLAWREAVGDAKTPVSGALTAVADGPEGLKALAAEVEALGKQKDHAARKKAADALAARLKGAVAASVAAEEAVKASGAARAAEKAYRDRYGEADLGENPALEAASKALAAGDAAMGAKDFGKAAESLTKAAADFATALKTADGLARPKAEALAGELEGLGGAALIEKAAAVPAVLHRQEALASMARERGLARLIVSGSGAVSVRSMNDAGAPSGAAIAVGSAPVDFPFLPAGKWQVRVGELTMPFVVAEKATIAVRADDAPEGMALVPASSGVVAKAGPRDFWVARDELTRERYQAYLEATNAPAPPHWVGRKAPGDGKVPVRALRWDEAFYCALWAGGRLLYRAEYDRAATGGADWAYPWGATADPKRVVTGSSEPGKPGPRGPSPVGGRAAGASPYGVRDLVGNVSELLLPGDPARAGKIEVAGGSFVAAPDSARLTAPAQVGDRDGKRLRDMGFRIARSVLVAADGSPLSVEAALADKALETAAPGVVIEALRQAAAAGNVEALWGKLGSERDLVRRAAGFYLVTAKGGREWLASKLKDGDANVRRLAANAIASGPVMACDDLLVPLASDADAGLRKIAYQRLGGPPRKAFYATYVAGLNDADAEVRATCLNAMLPFPDAAQVATVRTKLSDADLSVRVAAIYVLCAWRQGDAADMVITCLQSLAANQKALDTAVPLLGLLGPDKMVASARKLARSQQTRPVALMVLGQMGSAKDIETILAGLRQQNTASMAFTGLLELRSDRSNATLTSLLTNPGINAQTAMVIARTLGESKYAGAIPKLIEVIGKQSTPPQAKGQLLLQVAAIGGPTAKQAIFQAWSDQKSPLRGQLVSLQALARVGHEQAIPLMRRLLQDANRPANQKLALVTTLALAGDQQVKPQMKAIIAASPVWAPQLGNIAISMGRILTADEIFAYLKGGVMVEQMVGAVSVREFQGTLDPAKVAELLPTLPLDPQVQLMIGLGRRRAFEHIPAIEALLKSPDLHPTARVQALVALEGLMRAKYRVSQGGKR